MDFFLLYQYIVAAVLLVIMINFIINNFLFKNTIKHKLPESFLKSKPLISVLIPARNEEDNIKRCINSLLKQDYDNLGCHAWLFWLFPFNSDLSIAVAVHILAAAFVV